jgi:hypothetical protein
MGEASGSDAGHAAAAAGTGRREASADLDVGERGLVQRVFGMVWFRCVSHVDGLVGQVEEEALLRLGLAVVLNHADGFLQRASQNLAQGR